MPVAVSQMSVDFTDVPFWFQDKQLRFLSVCAAGPPLKVASALKVAALECRSGLRYASVKESLGYAGSAVPKHDIAYVETELLPHSSDSSVYPFTADEVLCNRLNTSGHRIGLVTDWKCFRLYFRDGYNALSAGRAFLEARPPLQVLEAICSRNLVDTDVGATWLMVLFGAAFALDTCDEIHSARSSFSAMIQQKIVAHATSTLPNLSITLKERYPNLDSKALKSKAAMQYLRIVYVLLLESKGLLNEKSLSALNRIVDCSQTNDNIGFVCVRMSELLDAVIELHGGDRKSYQVLDKSDYCCVDDPLYKLIVASVVRGMAVLRSGKISLFSVLSERELGELYQEMLARWDDKSSDCVNKQANSTKSSRKRKGLWKAAPAKCSKADETAKPVTQDLPETSHVSGSNEADHIECVSVHPSSIPVIGIQPEDMKNGWALVREATARLKESAYYTPPSAVYSMVSRSLKPVLNRAICSGMEGASTLDKGTSIRCLDPAVGSGYFLLGAAEYIVSELKKVCPGGGHHHLDEIWKRAAACLWGVDRSATAACLARCTLLLACASRPEDVAHLAAVLATQVRVGDSLCGCLDSSDLGPDINYSSPDELRMLCDMRLDPASGWGKKRNETCRVWARGDDGEANYFHWFLEMGSAAEQPLVTAPQFDVVVANPPWRVLQPEIGTNAEKEYFDNVKSLCDLKSGLLYRNVEGGTKSNLYNLFLERCVRLLKPGGYLSFVVQSSIWSTTSSRCSRLYLQDQCEIQEVIEFDKKVLFPAVNKPSTLISARRVTGDSCQAPNHSFQWKKFLCSKTWESYLSSLSYGAPALCDLEGSYLMKAKMKSMTAYIGGPEATLIPVYEGMDGLNRLMFFLATGTSRGGPHVLTRYDKYVDVCTGVYLYKYTALDAPTSDQPVCVVQGPQVTPFMHVPCACYVPIEGIRKKDAWLDGKDTAILMRETIDKEAARRFVACAPRESNVVGNHKTTIHICNLLHTRLPHVFRSPRAARALCLCLMNSKLLEFLFRSIDRTDSINTNIIRRLPVPDFASMHIDGDALQAEALSLWTKLTEMSGLEDTSSVSDNDIPLLLDVIKRHSCASIATVLALLGDCMTESGRQNPQVDRRHFIDNWKCVSEAPAGWMMDILVCGMYGLFDITSVRAVLKMAYA